MLITKIDNNKRRMNYYSNWILYFFLCDIFYYYFVIIFICLCWYFNIKVYIKQRLIVIIKIYINFLDILKLLLITNPHLVVYCIIVILQFLCYFAMLSFVLLQMTLTSSLFVYCCGGESHNNIFRSIWASLKVVFSIIEIVFGYEGMLVHI